MTTLQCTRGRPGWLAMLSLFLLPAGLGAQEQWDRIVQVDGTVIECKVIEVTTDAVKYRRAANPDGPIYSIAKADVTVVVYANGETERFTRPTPPAEQERREAQPPPGAGTPGAGATPTPAPVDGSASRTPGFTFEALGMQIPAGELGETYGAGGGMALRYTSSLAGDLVLQGSAGVQILPTTTTPSAAQEMELVLVPLTGGVLQPMTRKIHLEGRAGVAFGFLDATASEAEAKALTYVSTSLGVGFRSGWYGLSALWNQLHGQGGSVSYMTLNLLNLHIGGR